jgi:hypothetical protein
MHNCGGSMLHARAVNQIGQDGMDMDNTFLLLLHLLTKITEGF